MLLISLHFSIKSLLTFGKMNHLQNKAIVKQMAEDDKATLLNNHSKLKIISPACLEVFLLSLLLLELDLFF